MSKKCYACGKTRHVGNKVSHSMKHSKRLWEPNLQAVNIMVYDKKKKKQIKIKERVCTKCLKAGKVRKAI
ncbi:50S ribosomal protein L28 [Candidatus Saganbacteria bacterium CG08_land_8_20_14_0_20_45_16]|uniref:Large ribosomal subunit protein bL28 n=1 Tax=Candidatus Saganbacteria bacterium CG08_land_8_20_14_0_20_45_16 TaxID=2014293 RepID=A0A2H0XYJ1_UNCSA|nr:MAG: 50S ribosomal protein L28 [Candidatus Saganbacteria bacterium CG08_land_8_20_14_0_20_45_16]